MLRATALGLARVGEGETGIPTPEPIAAETWEPTGADASTAVAGLAPLVTDPAAYGSQQGQGGPEDANCREEADNATPPLGETASAAVGAVPASTVTPRRGSRRSPLEQAAQTRLDAWDARACGNGDTADTLNGHVADLRSALEASASVAAAIATWMPFFARPARNPRTVCEAQPIVLAICGPLAPSFRRSMAARTCACFGRRKEAPSGRPTYPTACGLLSGAGRWPRRRPGQHAACPGLRQSSGCFP